MAWWKKKWRLRLRFEGEENVAKKARRLSFDERSCIVNTLEDDLEDDGGDYNDYDYDEDYLPWISDSESDG